MNQRRWLLRPTPKPNPPSNQRSSRLIRSAVHSPGLALALQPKLTLHFFPLLRHTPLVRVFDLLGSVYRSSTGIGPISSLVLALPLSDIPAARPVPSRRPPQHCSSTDATDKDLRYQVEAADKVHRRTLRAPHDARRTTHRETHADAAAAPAPAPPATAKQRHKAEAKLGPGPGRLSFFPCGTRERRQSPYALAAAHISRNALSSCR